MKPMRTGAFLTRLKQDTCGNTLAIMAAAIIPLVGLIGGGVDMSRMYLVKTRLQQACDAGALSGRKAMGGGDWSADAEGRADELFTANFASGAYGTTGLVKDFEHDDGVVTGTASVAVPMTLMRVFGFAQETLSVSCTARMEIPNTDVMFVLDETLSMAGWRMEGLQSAVMCFYEALLRANTDEVCGNDPADSTYDGTAQIRLGFVPYAVNVNVGRLLPNNFIADNWQYQTRQGAYYVVGAPTGGSAFNETRTFSRSRDCDNWAKGTDATGFPSTNTAPTSFTVTTAQYTPVGYDSRTDVCTRRVNQSQVLYTRDDVNGTFFHTWFYRQASLNVSGLKAGGSNWQNGVDLRVGDDGEIENVRWDGCIEERPTHRNLDGNPAGEFNPIPATALDLDIDLMPNPANPATQWGPMLPDAVWGRTSGGNNTLNTVTTANNLNPIRAYFCPSPARRLREYRTAADTADFEDYIGDLDPISQGTYHDIGLLWGARLLSPTGIFGADNALTANGGAIERHLIFMTDGNAQTVVNNLYAYGLPWWDRRQTPPNSAPTTGLLDSLVNERLLALCSRVKSMNITLWVISYGGGVDAANEARLSQCATPGRYYSAADGAALINQFRQIANEIADLRLTS